VLDDLLHAFSGLDGRYVRARLEDGPGGARVAYALHGRPDAALRELTARMLPLWWAPRPHRPAHPARAYGALSTAWLLPTLDSAWVRCSARVFLRLPFIDVTAASHSATPNANSCKQRREGVQ
jgi:hypothetical protein